MIACFVSQWIIRLAKVPVTESGWSRNAMSSLISYRPMPDPLMWAT